eukprot:13922809-Heterocapsa_arctica.AAC.1
MIINSSGNWSHPAAPAALTPTASAPTPTAVSGGAPAQPHDSNAGAAAPAIGAPIGASDFRTAG